MLADAPLFFLAQQGTIGAFVRHGRGGCLSTVLPRRVTKHCESPRSVIGSWSRDHRRC
ncbi:hypothetical protein BC940DRAFT_294477 [Gongronella butleri]|nr:hypothetical protein BC940DRAFT_294477 [Gongronella butleri]